MSTRRPASDRRSLPPGSRPSSPPADERALVRLLTRGWPRSPRQLNRPWEADAELVRLGSEDGPVLALTTDSLVEEIESGLYRDPATIGWVAVVAAASDLAAVGARPLGLLVDVSLPRGMSAARLRRLGGGIRVAARAHGLPVLGGDTNRAASLRVGITAAGLVDGAPLTRRGARPGDLLCATGRPGAGSSFAFRRFLGAGTGGSDVAWRPRARLREGARLRGLANSCIDTSDGVLPALRELLRSNGVGATLDLGGDVLHPQALRTAARHRLPPWIFLAGPHGEYELLFSVPPSRRRALAALAHASRTPIVPLGRIEARPGLRIDDGSRRLCLDVAAICRLSERAGDDPRACLEALLRIDARAPQAAPASAAAEIPDGSGEEPVAVRPRPDPGRFTGA